MNCLRCMKLEAAILTKNSGERYSVLHTGLTDEFDQKNGRSNNYANRCRRGNPLRHAGTSCSTPYSRPAAKSK